MARLHLEPSCALPRQLIISKTARTWMVSLNLPGCTYQAVFAAAESLRITRTSGTPVLWVGDTAFDLLEHEAQEVAAFARIPFPVKPVAAGVQLVAPGFSDPSLELRA